MYGLGALIRSRLFEEYYGEENSYLGGLTKGTSKKHKFTKTVLKQINKRDFYIAKALRTHCVYEVSQAKELYYDSIRIQDLNLSNYALTVLNIHIGNLSARLQKIKKKLQSVSSKAGDHDPSEILLLKSELAHESMSLAMILEQGAKLYEQSFKLQLKRYYENMQILESRDMTEPQVNKMKESGNSIQEKLQKGHSIIV